MGRSKSEHKLLGEQSAAKSERLDPFEFGERLIITGDLDPVYILLYESNFDTSFLRKWLLAYWCFYHCGTASWITDQENYWDAMKEAASSKDYNRGSERRHFRGLFATRSVNWLELEGIDDLFDYITFSPYQIVTKTAKSIMEEVNTWYGFGNWIAFKIADMLERLDIIPVEFTNDDVFNMYDSPRQGAGRMAEYYDIKIDYIYTWAIDNLSAALKHLKAPPRYERKLNIQEFETILCKWNSHMKGHYKIGKDIEEIKHGLEIWKPHSVTATTLYNIGIKSKLWS